MSFTKRSGTPENKVYEKLRKRSLRLRNRRFGNLVNRLSGWRAEIDHEAYVRGVRDAIKELRANGPRAVE